MVGQCGCGAIGECSQHQCICLEEVSEESFEPMWTNVKDEPPVANSMAEGADGRVSMKTIALAAS